MAETGVENKSLGDDIGDIQEAPRYSCSLAGAYASTLGVYGAVPILHSGGGCGVAQLFGQFYTAGECAPGVQGGTGTPCTSLVEQHVIFGGEDRLRKLIKSTTELMDGSLFVVITGCVPALIGDDVESVVREFKADTKNKIPIIYVNAAGFSGNTYHGYELFFNAVIDQYLVPLKKKKRTINIFGVVPFQHVFWKGDLEILKNTFAKIGVEANIIFTEFSGPEKLKRIPAAELNLVLNPWLGHSIVQRLEETFGTPYIAFPSVPVGPKQTTALLGIVAEKLGIPEKKVKDVVAAEERKAYRNVEYF